MVAGPLIGLIIVIVAYGLGILLSILCCKTDDRRILDEEAETDGRNGSQGVDVFIVSRSEHYATFGLPTNSRGPPAPAYEAPPSYEECLKQGFPESV